MHHEQSDILVPRVKLVNLRKLERKKLLVDLHCGVHHVVEWEVPVFANVNGIRVNLVSKSDYRVDFDGQTNRSAVEIPKCRRLL